MRNKKKKIIWLQLRTVLLPVHLIADPASFGAIQEFRLQERKVVEKEIENNVE